MAAKHEDPGKCSLKLLLSLTVRANAKHIHKYSVISKVKLVQCYATMTVNEKEQINKLSQNQTSKKIPINNTNK